MRSLGSQEIKFREHINAASHRVPKETFPLEKRVATVPEAIEKLKKLGFEIAVEAGAGEGANVSDADYTAAGATVHPNAVGAL